MRPEREVERVTLESVAAHARVSRQTVSNVINTPHVVREETRARVRESIHALGYRPSRAARQLRTRRSQVLGFAVPPVGDETVGDRFVHALTVAAQARGYRIMIFAAESDAAEIDQYPELLHGADLDGFVLTNTHRGDPRTVWLAEHGVPFVTFGRPWDTPGSAPAAHSWVDVDGAAGTDAATRHLHGLGHRRIAFLGWPTGSGVGDDREAGWARGLRALGGTPQAGWVGRCVNVPRAAHEAAVRLLADADPTAIVCVSDAVALGALDAAREAGRAVAATGFDDSYAAEVVGLTSLAQPLAEAAATAVEMVLHQMGAPGAAPRSPHALLAPELRVRTSSLPPAP